MSIIGGALGLFSLCIKGMQIVEACVGYEPEFSVYPANYMVSSCCTVSRICYVDPGQSTKLSK